MLVNAIFLHRVSFVNDQTFINNHVLSYIILLYSLLVCSKIRAITDIRFFLHEVNTVKNQNLLSNVYYEIRIFNQYERKKSIWKILDYKYFGNHLEELFYEICEST